MEPFSGVCSRSEPELEMRLGVSRLPSSVGKEGFGDEGELTLQGGELIVSGGVFKGNSVLCGLLCGIRLLSRLLSTQRTRNLSEKDIDFKTVEVRVSSR